MHRTERGQQGEGGSPPFCSALGRPHPEHWAQCWAAQFKAGRELLGRAREGLWRDGGLEHLLCEERLRALGLFSVGRRRLRGDLSNVYKYLKGGHQVNGVRLFSVLSEVVPLVSWCLPATGLGPFFPKGQYWGLSCSISLLITWMRALSAPPVSLQMTPS